MPSIDVTLELVTPAYAGGASPEQCDGLRPPVLKALLRFWWRAMHPELPPDELFMAEAGLFGSTGDGQRLRVIPLGDPTAMECQRPGQSLPGDTAFLSYGVSEWAREARGFRTNRPRVATGQTIRFRLAWGNKIPCNAEEEFVKTLWLLSTFSGWGTKARRGWGSIHVDCPCFGGAPYTNLKDPHGAASVDDLRNRLQAGLTAILGPRAGISLQPGSNEAEHTAFSPDTRLFIGPGCQNAEDALDKLGQVYNRYRRALGAGRNHAPGAVGPDHQKRSNWCAKPPVKTDVAPLGSAFGLPHLARFTKGPRVDVGVGADLTGRRASPVFFKVLRCGARFVPAVLWLPARFLPVGTPVCVRAPAGESEVRDPGVTGIAQFFDGNPELMCYARGGGAWLGLRGYGWTEVNW